VKIESFARLLGLMRTRNAKIVEFGCGTGNLSLSLASLFPAAHFILIDMKPVCLQLARIRAKLAGLRNVDFHDGKIEDVDFDFDIGLALHVCGCATDLAMDQCYRAKASFLVSPCCIGKLKESVIQYPRSSWLKKSLSMEQYVGEVVSVADHNGKNREAKLVVEKDRMSWAEEMGYECSFFQMPPDAGPKGDIIVGNFK